MPAEHSPSRRVGFTLVELVVVILVIGILTGVAAPKLFDVSTDAQIAAIMRHIEVGHGAAELYFAEHGDYPDDARHGTFPPQLEGYLNAAYFEELPPGGGVYDWNGEGVYGGVYAGFSIYVTRGRRPLELWKLIDERYDDGNLSTGAIKAYGSRTLQFELAP